MRKRILAPGFFSNESIGGLPPLARLLFLGLLCMADREGRLEYRPVRIRINLFPYDDNVGDRQIIDWLATMAHGDDPLIEVYASGKKHIIQICNFLKYQRPHRNEARSELPSRAECDTDVAAPAPKVEKKARKKVEKEPEEKPAPGPTPGDMIKEFFRASAEGNKPMFEVVTMWQERLGDQLGPFCAYWTEPNKKGTKVRWEMEKAFSIPGRIGTWMSRRSAPAPKQQAPPRQSLYTTEF